MPLRSRSLYVGQMGRDGSRRAAGSGAVILKRWRAFEVQLKIFKIGEHGKLDGIAASFHFLKRTNVVQVGFGLVA